MRVSEAVLLPCDVEAAWGALAQWEAQSRWMADADWVRVEGDLREGVGVRIAVRTRLYNVPVVTERLEVTVWDPPHRMEIAHRSVIRGSGSWDLRERGEQTGFTWSEDVTLPVVGDAIASIYRPFLRRVMRRSMANLAAVLGGHS